LKGYFTTIVRSAPVPKGGELVKLDWEARRVEARAPIAPHDPEIDDPNPRGNARGGRGIAFAGDEVIAASYHSLEVFDRDLRPRRTITHPLFAGLHEVFLTPRGTLWAASTAIDAALEVDLSTGRDVRQVWPREIPNFQDRLRLEPADVDKTADNRTRWLEKAHSEHRSHLHLNAVGEWNGETLALLNGFGVIVNLDSEKIVLHDKRIRGGHNLLIGDDGTATVNDSLGRTVRVYDLSERRPVRIHKLRAFPEVTRIVRRHDRAFRAKKALRRLGIRLTPPRPLFVRGADRAGDLLFVGLSPASILAIDERRGTVAGLFRYSKDVRVCVHGLRVLPD